MQELIVHRVSGHGANGHRSRHRLAVAATMVAAVIATLTVHSLAQGAPPANKATEDKMKQTLPADVDPLSGFRLPLPKREDLDEGGRVAYDRGTKPGATIAGLQGPSGVQLYSPKTAAHVTALNNYLRFEAGYSPHIREVVILATAREMDSQFEWVAHEPEALKQGVPQAVIDTIKFRRPLTGPDSAGIDATDALLIDLVRQLWRDHKVKPETFAALKAKFGPTALVELVMLSGNYAGTAALLTAVDMQLHAGKEPLLPIP